MGWATGGGFDHRLTPLSSAPAGAPARPPVHLLPGEGLARPCLPGSDLLKDGWRLGQMSSPLLCIPVSTELQLFHEDVLAFQGCENHVEGKFD